jgi:hypothetical protein
MGYSCFGIIFVGLTVKIAVYGGSSEFGSFRKKVRYFQAHRNFIAENKKE